MGGLRQEKKVETTSQPSTRHTYLRRVREGLGGIVVVLSTFERESETRSRI